MDYSFKNFQRKAIIRFLALDKYNYIRENLYKCDVSKDIEFQTNFNAFYRVRRDEPWRKVFYNYFQKIKNNKNIKFEEILQYLYDNTDGHNVEASFSSKLLATINPDMPIWDQYVLKNLEIKIDKNENRLLSIIKAYKEVIHKEQELLKRDDVKTSIKKLQDEFKEYELSDIKALDYILWNSRDLEDK